MTGFPVASPPANLRRASGAKLKNLGNDKSVNPGVERDSAATTAPQAENVTVHIAVMPFSLFRAIIPDVFSDSA
jgi:hypothetical protein